MILGMLDKGYCKKNRVLELLAKIFGQVASAPLKKKFVRGNHASYMTKQLRKAIMRSSKLESKQLKNRTIDNKTKFKKQNNFCSKLYKKERKKYIF